MSDREKEILEAIAEALPRMPEFDKGYLLGKAETMVADRKTEKSSDDKTAEEPKGSD
jgi:hypothetical protein